jgi:hypothetical protein
VLEAVFILLEFPSPSRRIFIGSHSLPPSLVRRISPSRDTTNVKYISDDITLKVKHGTHQGMTLTFWNKDISYYSILTSDSQLMSAFDMYWDPRLIPLTVTIYDTISVVYSQQQTTQSSQDHLHLALIQDPSDLNVHVVHGLDGSASQQGSDGPSVHKSRKGKKGKDLYDDEEPWIDDEEEYVGLNDEAPYISDVEADIASGHEAADMSDISSDHESSDSDLNEDDELVVADSIG